MNSFQRLVSLANKSTRPTIIIGTNEKIELFFAMHFKDFKNNYEIFLKSKGIDEKNDSRIYYKCNCEDKSSLEIALPKLVKMKGKSYIHNDIRLKEGIISKNKITLDDIFRTQKHTNIIDLLDCLN
jgi:hypothetical protein